MTSAGTPWASSEFVWRWLDAVDFETLEPTPGTGYEFRFAVTFLDEVPDAATRANGRT